MPATALRFDRAVNVLDIDSLRALTAFGSPNRVDGGLYYVTDTGNGFGRWAQYLESADSAEIPGRIIEPNDGIGRFILSETSDSTGSGLAIISESQPFTTESGSLWFNPVSKVLRIYANNIWESLTVDDGQY
jgi:hypothetical protein